MIPVWHQWLFIALVSIHACLVLWLAGSAIASGTVRVYLKLVGVCLISTLPGVVLLASYCIKYYMEHKL